MSFKPNQWIIAGVAGLTTAVGVAYATISNRPSPTPTPTITHSSAEPPTPSSGVSVAPANPPTPVTPTPSEVVVKPPVTGCRISMAVVDDPEPPLNVRSTPEVVNGNIVGQLDNNTFVSVVEEQKGWFKISNPVEGWIAGNRTRSSCANVEKSINFLPGGNSAVIQGEIVGGGSHRYRLNGEAGQTLTVESRRQVFPRIVTPDGKLLAGDPSTDSSQKEWTGKLPTTGQYILELDSNFRGFEYEFWVQVQ